MHPALFAIAFTTVLLLVVPPALPTETEQTVEGVEAGFKLNLLDNRMRFNGSVFSYDYTDMQLSTFDQIALVQRVLNAGESTVQGAELDMQYLPESVECLSLSLRIAYTDAAFDSFIGPCYGGQTEAEGCMALPSGSGFSTQPSMFSTPT